jgi:hypothetical protein
VTEPVAAGRWARVHRLELAPSERAPGVPPDTAAVPFETWVNGWLVEPARLGAAARLRTAAGRVVEGVLESVDPGYDHSFGSPPESLQAAAAQARALVFEAVS